MQVTRRSLPQHPPGGRAPFGKAWVSHSASWISLKATWAAEDMTAGAGETGAARGTAAGMGLGALARAAPGQVAAGCDAAGGGCA